MFYDNRKKIDVFSPPPVDELFDGLSGKNFLGNLKKNIVQRNVAEKKNSCKQLGDEKKFVHRKIAQTPPPQISNGPSLTLNMIKAFKFRAQAIFSLLEKTPPVVHKI